MLPSTAIPRSTLALRTCLLIATVFWVYVCLTSLARWELMRQASGGSLVPREVLATTCALLLLPLWALTLVSWRVGHDLKRWPRLCAANLLLACVFGLCARPALYVAGSLLLDLSVSEAMVRFDGADPARALRLWGATSIEDAAQYLVLQGILVGASFYARLKAEQAMAERLASEYDRARLQALRMQTNPHFLFNTLSAIAGLVQPRPAAAECMVTRLGELFRATLADRDADFVPLHHELGLGRQYLEIQRTRFDERFNYHVHLPPELAQVAVLPLLLQPLLENAAEHGLASHEGAIEVDVRVSGTAEAVRITVSNRAQSGSERSSQRPLSGFGLENVRQRLRAAYADDASLTTRYTANGYFEADLQFPARLVEHAQRATPAPQPQVIAT